MVYLASKYVLDELKSEVNVYTTDAYTFMCMNESRFDLICMDVFVDDLIPEELESLDFTEMLRDTLAPGGKLIYNRLAYTAEDKTGTEHYFQNVFSKIFPDGRIYETGGNRMLLNF